MRFTFTLADWIFILRAWLDESYPLDQGKSRFGKSKELQSQKDASRAAYSMLELPLR